ncbi:ankyrin repeat domain-containing protein [bacterium]|nr:ankyrin repeat domain-containing protein [bacterium]
MKKLYKTVILFLYFISFNQFAFAESQEEMKCDLMMKGYEFSNNGLSEAIIKKDIEAVELFVKADININLPDNEGLRALDRAIKVNNRDTVILLSMAGGKTSDDINKKNNPQKIEKPKAEHEQILLGKTQTYTEEKENKVEINSLCEAINTGNLDLVAKTAKNSEYLNVLTSEGLAPLHYAIFNNNPAMVHLLLNAGADVNILTDDGLTPLDIAVLNEQKIIVKELLESGGALSFNVANELIKFGCNAVYDENFGLYDAEFDNIFETIEKIKTQI